MKADINTQLTLEQYIMTKVQKLLLHSMTEMRLKLCNNSALFPVISRKDWNFQSLREMTDYAD